ncbi:MAG: type II secretion system F family protein [Candidatus Sumerlaeaceae bacterium]
MREDPPRPQYPPIHTKPKRVVSAAPAPGNLNPDLPLLKQFGKPSNRDWFFFSLELRTLLSAGVPVIQALKLLETSSERLRVKRAAGLVGARLAQGSSLVAAVRGDRDLPLLVQALLILGQQSGRLTTTLDLIVRHYQWMLEIRGLILRSIWYPAALVVLGSFIMVGRDTTIASMTGKMDTIQAFWHYLNVYFGPVVMGTIAALIVSTAIKLRQFRRAVDAFILTVPGLGGVSKKYAVGVFFEVLSATVEAGMPVTLGYEMAAASAPNVIIGERLAKWVHYIADGESLGETLRQTGVLDPDALAMVIAGEASAEAPFLMRRLASYYHDEIRVRTRMLVSIYTPFSIPVVAIGYFISASVLGWLAFVLVFLFRII